MIGCLLQPKRIPGKRWGTKKVEPELSVRVLAQLERGQKVEVGTLEVVHPGPDAGGCELEEVGRQVWNVRNNF